MNTSYLINWERTKAFKIEGEIMTKVEFKFIQLGDFKEIESSTLHQKVSEKDLQHIRQNALPTDEASFNAIALKSAMFNLNQLLPAGEQITAGDLIIQKH
jgi:hypothetical protein